MASIICSFFEVVVQPKTLVICDIDHTLLTWPKKYKDFTQKYIPMTMILRCLPNNSDIEYSKYCENTPPRPTDLHGFRDLVKRVEERDGELLFLTARGEESHGYTINQFKMIGVDNKHHIHYTNGSHDKGAYISNRIDISRFNHVVFIDDTQHVLDTVMSKHPAIRCYKFVAS
jgi:hypothetical protein